MLRKLLKRHKICFVVVCAQLLILLGLFTYHIVTPRATLILSASDLAAEPLSYTRVEGDCLIYDIPYFCSVESPSFSLKPGAYNVFAQYEMTPLDITGTGQIGTPKFSINRLCITSKRQPSNIITNPFDLKTETTTLSTRLWCHSLRDISDLHVSIFYLGDASVSIQNITFVESLTYRFVTLAALGLLFLAVDALYFFFYKTRNQLSLQKRALFLMGIALFACYPLFCNFNVAGHDYTFHLARIVSVAQELQNGQFPVRMMTGMVNGYSYPNSIFYCDIFLYLPALLYLCRIPLYLCYQIYIGTITLATVAIAVFSFYRITKSAQLSLIGTALYTLSTYRICCVYTRAAVGEYTAMTFFPLVAAGIYTIYTEEKPRFKDWILLSLGMAGIVQSHILSSELIVIFFAILCIVLFKKTLQKVPFFALVKATGTTILLSCWFIVPFLASIDSSIYIFSAEKAAPRIQSHGLYLPQLFSVFTTYSGYSNEKMAQEMPLSLGFSLTIGLCCALYCLLHRNEWKLRTHRCYPQLCLCFGLSLLACTFTLRCFPWDSTFLLFGDTVDAFFSTIQFSWRYLSVATLAATLSTLFALKFIQNFDSKHYSPIVCSLFACIILINGYYYVNFLNEPSTYTYIDSNHALQNTIMSGEYLLTGTDHTAFTSATVLTESEQVELTDTHTVRGDKYFTLHNSSNHPQWVTLPVQNYKNYHVYDTTNMKEFEITNGENNNITTTLPSDYQGTLVVRYESPILWRISELISLISVLVILFSLGKPYLAKRNKRLRESAHATM